MSPCSRLPRQGHSTATALVDYRSAIARRSAPAAAGWLGEFSRRHIASVSLHGASLCEIVRCPCSGVARHRPRRSGRSFGRSGLAPLQGFCHRARSSMPSPAACVGTAELFACGGPSAAGAGAVGRSAALKLCGGHCGPHLLQRELFTESFRSQLARDAVWTANVCAAPSVGWTSSGPVLLTFARGSAALPSRTHLPYSMAVTPPPCSLPLSPLHGPVDRRRRACVVAACWS